MQAVILAGGKGTRLIPLTITRPKPIIGVGDSSILEYNLNQLQTIVDEVVIVVGYKADLVKKRIGANYGKIKVKYVFQEKQTGTGSAAKTALAEIKDRFILLNGDDLYGRRDIERVIQKKQDCILLKKEDNASRFGQALVGNGYLEGLFEKPKKQKSDLVNTGLYWMHKSIFDYKIGKSQRGEYEFPDYVKRLIKDKEVRFEVADKWVPVSYSWNLLDANKSMLKSIGNSIFVGKNCQISPDSYIGPFSRIGNNCRIGKSVEIENSIIGDGCKIGNLVCVRDSIIGENCDIGEGTIILNLGQSEKSVKSMIDNNLVDTRRKKFGTVFGDRVKTGARTIIYPGIKIWPGKTTAVEEIVKKDIM